jgi:hypothetical protein
MRTFRILGVLLLGVMGACASSPVRCVLDTSAAQEAAFELRAEDGSGTVDVRKTPATCGSGAKTELVYLVTVRHRETGLVWGRSLGLADVFAGVDLGRSAGTILSNARLVRQGGRLIQFSSFGTYLEVIESSRTAATAASAERQMLERLERGVRPRHERFALVELGGRVPSRFGTPPFSAAGRLSWYVSAATWTGREWLVTIHGETAERITLVLDAKYRLLDVRGPE